MIPGRGFDCECLRCGAAFTVLLPRVICDACIPEVAEEHERVLIRLAEDFGIMVGDTVRLKTEADKEFERDVAADLATL